MPLLSIFTKVEDCNKNKSVFGCAECVCVRFGDRTISLVKVANIERNTPLHNFPELKEEVRLNCE